MSRCAILVTDRQLLPITSGNRIRILGVIAALRALGWKVVLVARPDVAPPEQLRPLLDGFAAVNAPPFLGGDMARFDVAPFRRAVERLVHEVKPALVIAEYAWLAPALSRIPRFIRRVIDCHDVMHERTSRFHAAGLHPWVVCTREEEARLLSVGDVILATQEREAALFRQMLPRTRVDCILTPIELPHGFARTATTSNVVLTVGANHPGNAAVLDFARDVWPAVTHRIPDARLHVVGGIGSLLPALPGVDCIGHVDDLRPHYAAASVVVCPVTTGTGVKTKMLEALRYGRATIVTVEATEGLPLPARRSWVTVPTLYACADAIVALMGDLGERAELEAAAFEFGELHLAQRPFRAKIAAFLPNAATRSLAHFFA
jgi:glycosyltransferase involved in cell wall biosynthesis